MAVAVRRSEPDGGCVLSLFSPFTGLLMLLLLLFFLPNSNSNFDRILIRVRIPAIARRMLRVGGGKIADGSMHLHRCAVAIGHVVAGGEIDKSVEQRPKEGKGHVGSPMGGGGIGGGPQPPVRLLPPFLGRSCEHSVVSIGCQPHPKFEF